MPYSTIEPTNIYIDKIENGIATILVRWNKSSDTKTDMTGQTYVEWSYDERRITWTLPAVYSTVEEVQVYLDGIYESGDLATGQILNWAKASQVSF